MGLPSIAGYVQTPTAWGVIKNVSAVQIINAFSSIGATTISDGNIYFSSLPAGHLVGDKYKIVLEQGASSTSDPNADTSGSINGYTRHRSSSAYVMEGEEAEPEEDE